MGIKPAWVSFGPLGHIPIRLHERAGMRMRALNELKVLRRNNLNLQSKIIRMFVVSNLVIRVS